MTTTPGIAGYRVERELGRGGMATVYLAEQLSLGRLVALKVLHPQYAGDPAVAQRFLREGRVAASLQHRHIVAVHDVGRDGDRLYMALEYLPLGSIAALAGTMPEDAVLRCVCEIAGALDAAHRKGIVHRDVKPENILRHADGAFMLSDFGIAQIVDGGHALTREGHALGTPAYMSPEQWRDDLVDGRADLYSLGVVFHQMLTGETPFHAADAIALGMQHLNAPIPKLPPAHAQLQPLLDALLAKVPTARIGSGVEVARLAASLAGDGAPGSGAAGHPDATRELNDIPAPPRNDRISNPRRQALWAAATVLAVGAAAGGWWEWSRPSPADISAAGASSELATVAVLPCSNWLRDPSLAWLSEGLADELIQRLARLRGIQVIARASSFALHAQDLTAADIGRRLDADALVTCSLRDSPGGIRVTAELTDVATQRQRWAVQYDRAPEAILGAIDEVSVGVAERLLTSLVGEQRAQLLRHDTDNLEALKLYQASIPLGESWTKPSLEQAEVLLRRSLELDPEFALAHQAQALLRINRMQIDNLSLQEAAPAIDSALAEALRLNPDLGEAYAVRCQLDFFRYDWKAARSDCDQAVRLAPNSGRVHYLVGQYEFAFGDAARGIEHELRFREIEPENPFAWQQAAGAYIYGGEAARGLIEADRAVARYPGHWVSHWMRAMALLQLRRCAEAAAAFEQVARIESNLEFIGVMGGAYACAGKRNEAIAMRDRLRAVAAGPHHISELNLAVTELELGHRDAAIDALERGFRGYDQSTNMALGAEVFGLQRLRGNPRYDALRDSYGFPPRPPR
jgi:serine/threonine protein kinase/tetratricopeptide (TPR) repeat protein